MTIKDLQLPLSDYKFGKIGQFYTKEEVDQLILYAVNEAKRIDEESMRKHNKEAKRQLRQMQLGLPRFPKA